MLAVLVVLGGVSVLLLFTATSAEIDTTSSAVETSSTVAETVMDRETSEVKSISVSNSEGSFVLVPDGDNFAIEGYEDCDVSTSIVTYSASSVLSMSATKNLGTQEGLAGFGLAGERAVFVEITYNDGTADSLVLGDAAPESSGNYVLKDNTVYIVSGVNTQLYGSMYAYFDSTLYTVDSRTEEVTDDEGNTTTQTLDDLLYNIKLSGTNFAEPIEVQYFSGDISTYLITTPIRAESGTDYYTSITEALKAPTATGVAAAHLTDELLEQFGLAQPYATIEFDLNNTQHTMSVSAKNSDGTRYLLLDDRDVIYTVSDDTLSTWAECTLMKLRMSYVWIENIMDVSKLEMTVEGDEVYSFDVTRTVNEEKSTDSSTSYDLTIKNVGGEDIDYKTCYQQFYKKLLAVSVLSTDTAEYSGTPKLRIEYSFFESDDTRVVEYYTVGEDRYAATVDGMYNGLVRKSDVDKLLQLLPQLNTNEDLS